MTTRRKVLAADLTMKGFKANPFRVFEFDEAGDCHLAVDLTAVGPDDIRDIRGLTNRMTLSHAIALFLIDKDDMRAMPTWRRGLALMEERYGDWRLFEVTGKLARGFEKRLAKSATADVKRMLTEVDLEVDPFVASRMMREIERKRKNPGGAAYRNLLFSLLALSRYLATVIGSRPPLIEGLPIPKSDFGARFAATEQQVIHLYIATEYLKPCDQETARLLIDFVRETAARSVSAQQLNLEDIDWRRGVVTIRGKGGYVHEAPVSQDLLRGLAAAGEGRWDGVVSREYNSAEWCADGTPAFVNSQGNRITKQWVTRLFVQLDNIVRDMEHDRITCHVLRHTTLTQVQRLRGLDFARSWANHRPGGKEGDDTARYTKVTLEERIALFDVMFPLSHTGGWDPINGVPVLRFVETPTV